ncbi:DUF2339 domain-containing protein [Chryseobacterium sp. SSA4.19]|uniref:DUF2339 domain-containing protein n=1 Tax=Chryseobacterium sp. SSA4.19 TaxID=2919915 RepID=UPI001F4D4D1F|nr:DUF2339 domain-containing protein [Chryseobacterium sp. SSA4.19]MCJ8153876.1 DUF2339 domain-containing protein [Chryseobacterium sp. SSA4.19]
MLYPLIIISIVVIFIIFNHLNTRVRKLEKEISELKKNFSGNSQIIKETETAETESLVPLHPEMHPALSNASPLLPEDIQQKQEKDLFGMVFEFLKQNALTIIGIFTLVLGIGYFVKYAIDRNWLGETARAGIGFASGAVMITISHFLRKNYAVFSSIVTGGGIAVFYFTATIAFREYHLFSQNAAFVVTFLITLLSLFLSYYYNSEILTIFSLSGGFLAPLMISTGESNYLFLFTYITVLNIGMLAIAYLKNWKSIGWISFLFTYSYLFFWTAEKPEVSGIYFYLGSYVIFYAFGLQNYLRKGSLLSSDILMLILTNFTSVIGLAYIFNLLQYEHVIIFPAGFALVNLGLLYREYSRKNFGTAYSVFAGIAAGLFTTAFALQFQAHLITSVWAIEATLLLFIWKKTCHSIFRLCFYILFPLVILAQIISWTSYADVQRLAIIFNPVFLTSSVTVVTTFVNLILLRKLPENSEDTNFFEHVFSIISYGIIYISFLLEIIYHISEKPAMVIFNIALLFSIFYIFLLLIFRKPLRIRNTLEILLLYLLFICIIIDTSIAGSGLISTYLLNRISVGLYFLYLCYLIPFIYIVVKILRATDFFKRKLSYWIFAGTVVTAASFETYHLYGLLNATNLSEFTQAGKHFALLYLPVIWAIIASTFIYKGMRNSKTEYSKIGFTLLALTILKLYIYDVWKMDNVSRIIAFIILGMILLFSSLIFQRLKKVIKNIIDKNKNENSPEKKP